MHQQRFRPSKETCGKSGFTLIELMVSSVILGMTVSAVAFMIINSSVARVGNDHNRQARIIAQEELEDTKHHFLRFSSNIELVDRPINLDPGEITSTPAVRNLPITTGSISITVASVTVQVPFKKLVSTVTWSDEGVAKSVTLAKRITEVR